MCIPREKTVPHPATPRVEPFFCLDTVRAFPAREALFLR
ncbi:hypothetical protein WCP94_000236 (plasmid) [Bilophila wadsworthia]